MPYSDIGEAIRNPAAAFSSPDMIVTDPKLTLDQKVSALQQWEYDMREMEVAEEEGMTNGGEDILQRILIALSALGYPSDVEHSSPSKQRPDSD